VKVRLSTAALADRRRADEYYDGSRALTAFRDELREAIRYIASYPHGAPRVRAEIRAKALRRFPYSILYRVSGDTIRILAIAHHAQDPDAFLTR
jgi:toxin ParE1/3/4